MASRSERLRRGLVAELERAGDITSGAVRQAFLDVPRERFVPEVGRANGLDAVYANRAIVTRTDAHGMAVSSSSQPTIMALMLEKLDLRPGDRVLEIGTGTGYNAALLSALVGPRGRVVSIELDPRVAREARARLREGGHRVKVVVGDGHEGWPDERRYDRIVATASTDVVPRAWAQQLADDGRVELPLRLNERTLAQAVVTFAPDGERLRSTAVVWGGFMPMRSRPEERYPDDGGVSITWSARGKRSTVYIGGRAVAALGTGARRRLVSLATDQPRSTRLPGRFDKASIETFLATTLDHDLVTCSRGGPPSMAVLTSDGASLARLGGKALAPLTRVEAWGDDRAAQKLLALVDEYRRFGRPGLAELSVTQTFGRRRPTAWRTARRGDAVLGYDWTR